MLPEKSAKTDKVLRIGIFEKLVSMLSSPVHFFFPDVDAAALEAGDGADWFTLLEMSLPFRHGDKSICMLATQAAAPALYPGALTRSLHPHPPRRILRAGIVNLAQHTA